MQQTQLTKTTGYVLRGDWDHAETVLVAQEGEIVTSEFIFPEERDAFCEEWYKLTGRFPS